MNLRANHDRLKSSTLEIFLLAILLVFLFSPSRMCAQSWRAVGPAGGDVRALAIDPAHQELVYLGTTDGHIFGSRDGGEHWRLLGLAGPTANAVVTSIIVDPRNSSVLYASTWTREREGEGGGVFLSADGGITWRETGLAGHAVRALVQAPSDPEILIAGALDGVFRFHNQSRTWERISPAGDAELRNFDSLSIDPLNPGVIYAGTFHLPWKTIDGGEHWVSIHRGMKDDSDVLSLAVDAANPQRVFASACSGIYRSEDAGALWREVQGIPNSSRRTPVIRMDPSNAAILYAGTTQGLWKSADGGANWRRISPGDWVVNSLVIEPGRERDDGTGTPPSATGRILVGTEDHGVLASDDGGKDFREVNNGFFHRRVVSLAVDSQNPGKIAAAFAGAQESIAASEDGGRTWAALGSGLNASDVLHLFSAPHGYMAALASGGLARFDPTQEKWSREGTIVESAVARSSASLVQVSSTRIPFTAHVNDLFFQGAAWFAATDQGLFVSSDTGAHWCLLPNAPMASPVNSVRVRSEGQKLRIVTARAMVFSDDAGATWQWHDLPLESGGALRLEFADDSTALVVSPSGLYMSRDSGDTWQLAGAGLPQGSLSGLLVKPEMWLVSLEAGGLYLSRDQGASWSRVENHGQEEKGIEDGKFPALAASSVEGLVYAGSSGEGLYVLDLSAAPEYVSGGASGK
jgi:photosystem II stability/assembly factor-like uncharacterized protein